MRPLSSQNNVDELSAQSYYNEKTKAESLRRQELRVPPEIQPSQLLCT